MKRIIAMTLVLALLLCGCGTGAKQETPRPETTEDPTEVIPETTAEPTTEPTTVPTTEPAPVYFNPLNGKILEEPFDGRICAVSIANTNDASIPHVNAYRADIIMEMFVNNSVVRWLGLYTDIASVEAIGSTRSTRLMFNDIAQHYNAILAHAGGVGRVLRDAKEKGLDHYNVDSLMRQGDELAKGTAYRSKEFPKQKYGEYNLFTIGAGVLAYAEAQGAQITGLPETDYGLLFQEDGTPASGEVADKINVTLTYGKAKKDTTMIYNPESGTYVCNQYGKEMADLITNTPEDFENVVVMHGNITRKDEFHVADFVAGGTGYYACGGRIIPITWTCESEQSPFRFFTVDGEPLYFGQGKTYIAICTPESKVTWEAVEPVETVPETTAETIAETVAETAAG